MKGKVAILLVCIVMSSVLSSVGITFVSPLLRILIFENPAPTAEVQSNPTAAPDGVAAADPSESLPLPARVTELRDKAQGWVEAHLYRGSRQDMRVRISVLLFVLYFLKNLFSFAQGAMVAILENKSIYEIRRSLFEAIQSLPLGFFTRERTGYMISRVIIDVDMMRGSIVGCGAQILSNGVMILIALTLVLAWSWQLALATFLVVPPNILLVALISKKLRKGSHRAQEEMGSLGAVLQETITGIRIVKAFNMQEAEASRYGKNNWNYYRAYTKLKILEALSSPVSEVLGITTAVVVLGFGGHLVFTGRLRPDLLFTFLAVMLWVIGPIKSLIKVNTTLQQSLAAARRVFDVLDTEREVAMVGSGVEVRAVERELHFDRVSFSYRADLPVLKQVDLVIPAGSTVALVGASGAGKSTMVDLIPRFYKPNSGRITIDGVDIESIELQSLRRLIGIVSQEVILFHDSVANNIAYGSPHASREEIVAAAKAANADEFISGMPHGYDTTVGERGLQISGGQRQRIAIARAILRDPSILIFDEATSSLDTESERLVQEAMDRLITGRTTLVIAHRLSTVTGADCIVVLDGGEIAEMGRHEELLARDGLYRRLYELQFRDSAATTRNPS